MTGVIEFILAALKAMPAILAAGQEAVGIIEQTRAAVAVMVAEGRGPSDAEWQALDDTIAGLMAELKD